MLDKQILSGKRATDVGGRWEMFCFFKPARRLQMWEILRAGGISSGTSSARREDSDWLQPRPGGPMGSEYPSCRSALPGKAGTWFIEQSLVHTDVHFQFSMINLSNWNNEEL